MDDIRIYGHNRSGTQVLSALIGKNFYNTDNYEFLFSGYIHAFPYAPARKGGVNPPKAKLNLYVWRNVLDVTWSIYRVRANLGLKKDISYEDFLRTPYSKMQTGRNTPLDEKDWVYMNYQHRTGMRKHSIQTFSGFKNTPVIHHQKHIMSWTRFKYENNRDDIYFVPYHMLQTPNGFQEIMEHIGEVLGDPRKEFEHVNHRVGWYLESERKSGGRYG